MSVLDMLLRIVATIPEGIPFAIRLREDLLAAIRSRTLTTAESASLRKLDSFLRLSFARQVAVEIRRITTKSDRKLLEFVRSKEAVHAIHDNDELAFRLEGPGHRCYDIFHPFMSCEPLAFVEVAIMDAAVAPTDISVVLDPTKAEMPTHPKSLVFYSVTNAMPGLSGLQLASYLLFLTIDAITSEFPSITNFVTISPAPMFAAWATAALQRKDAWMVTDKEALLFEDLLPGGHPCDKALLALQNMYKSTSAASLSHTLQPLILRWACRYIMFEKRRDGDKCLDPVANFHVSNGATVECINFGADWRSKALSQSFSVMVNYRYDLSQIGTAARRYARSGTLVATQTAMLLKSIGIPSVFDGVDAEVLRALRIPVCARVFPAHAWVVRPDDSATMAFYVLIVGKFSLYYKRSAAHDTVDSMDNYVKVGEMHPGAAIGALAVLEGRVPICYVKTEAKSYVLEIPIDGIVHILSKYPEQAKLIRKNAKRQLLDALQLSSLAGLKSKL